MLIRTTKRKLSLREHFKYDYTKVFVKTPVQLLALPFAIHQQTTDYHNKPFNLFYLFFTKLGFQEGCFRANVFKDCTVTYQRSVYESPKSQKYVLQYNEFVL